MYVRGLDAKRINDQNEKNELRSVLVWHPAAHDVGEMFSSLTPVNLKYSFPIPPGISLSQNDVYLKTSKMDLMRFASKPLMYM